MKMAKAPLEKMEYRFNVISDFYGNSFILDQVQRQLSQAINDVVKGDAIITYAYKDADNPKFKVKEERTKITQWHVKRHEYWLGDRYSYWSDQDLAAVGLTREERPLKKIQLEKMEYSFDVVSSWNGNDYILDKVQRWLKQAIDNVAKGIALEIGFPVNSGTNKPIDTKETHVDKWNVRRYWAEPDEEEAEGGENNGKKC